MAEGTKSTTTKEALKKLDDQLECSVCFEPFKQPKLLPCFHVFCKSPCLEKLVTKDGRSLTCPTCRHIVPLSERGVAGLQSDFHIDHLFEIQDAFNKAEKSTPTHCGSCEEDEAIAYCKDCSHFICDTCKNAHSKMAILQSHQIFTLHEVKDETASIIPPKGLARCSKHDNKKLKLYCETCQLLICSHCTYRLHRGHNFDLVIEVFPKHKEELVSLLTPLKKKLLNVRQALNTFDTVAKKVNDKRAAFETSIRKEIEEQHQILEQKQGKLLDTLQELTQQQLKSLAAQRDEVEITQVKMASCIEYAERGLETGTDSEILEMKVPVLKRIEQISAEYIQDEMHPELMTDVELYIGDRKDLQRVCIEIIKISETSLKFKGNTALFDIPNPEAPPAAKLVHIGSTDKTACRIVERQNNKYKVNYEPQNRGKHELRVTVNGNHVNGSPLTLKVPPTPQSFCKPVRTISAVRKPTSLAVNSKKHTIVTNKSCISILTQQGNKLNLFDTQESRNGQFSSICGVAVDEHDNIYVLENKSNLIQAFSSDGQCRAKFGGKFSGDLKNPHGICYNQSDNRLYVADTGNHKIHVFSTDLELVKSFGLRGNENGQFQNPHNIAFDGDNNLYVTDYSNDRVQVLTVEGQFLRAFSQKADGEKLKNPWAIAIDSADIVYVSEDGPYSVSVFTSHGKYITSFTSNGSEPQKMQCSFIYGLLIDHNDSLIVAQQSTNNLLKVF